MGASKEHSETVKTARSFDTSMVRSSFNTLADFCASKGFPDVLYARTCPPHFSSEDCFDGTLEGVTMYRRWNEQWEQRYIRERFQFSNRVWDVSRFANKPFRFKDIEPKTPQQKRFFEVASQYRQMNGFAVPFRGPGATVAGLSVSGAPDDRPVLDSDIEIIAAAFYAFHTTCDHHFSSGSAHHYDLTDREIEWIRLLALNDCTLNDIADATGVSAEVVRTGMAKVRKKFSAATNFRVIHLATKAGIA